eukprot:CAMPEP_0171287922 /NCGR_PEP_ID=MMETSP0790-20130122/69830_1 /TAXON_ID=2925 /ORGANISM="Alexandrium catenella, Strain OF101" /LENGTH=269 /DNA_ID=CAMNT_0011757517 /DNA_START=16 /DNA_END=821 /DNA_ORIENTATION=-
MAEEAEVMAEEGEEQPDALEAALAEAAAEGEEQAEEEAGGDEEEAPAEEEEAPAEEEEAPAEEDSDAEDAGVQEHLKDAVEGSLRLKRLLSRDDDDAPQAKKQKVVDAETLQKEAKIRQLLAKWQMTADAVSKHVLKGLSLQELNEIVASNWAPDKFHTQKSPPELLQRFVGDLKERKMVPGSSMDIVSAFKFYNKLDLASDKLLRQLKHKDLRYVLNEYDGSQKLDEVIAEAANHEPEELCTANAIPDYPGPSSVGRFNRLELIDPLA